ncbi:hypothetical protein SAMN02745945_02848 [Peptoclostridium litorale DSM 5388]|uniref:Uncharacterized protein n=1 Tax=Peptoclostridium litorale DSM 5388 TaxID=1121324 RepID=A0A069RID3_PEPLI|nr:hypothetical protein [Peptoclostridium litorale]KDR96771.1 hypothetical protein CLIT_2c03770 [Peptoclostridium litorale DSM 5388]SIO34585.1 hypothetical protein SAMN02745945_02848 [Peptoclostridium litorale DSM 5388]
MSLNIKKVNDILGNYFEIQIDNKKFSYGYEGSQDGEFLDKRYVLSNEAAIDFMMDNPDQFKWEKLYSSPDEVDAKELLELKLKSLGFKNTQFFVRGHVTTTLKTA